MNRLLLWLLCAYRAAKTLLPVPVRCRHWPSCSVYAEEALRIHGPAHGSWLALKRLARCRPGSTSGYDPVPEKP